MKSAFSGRWPQGGEILKCAGKCGAGCVCRVPPAYWGPVPADKAHLCALCLCPGFACSLAHEYSCQSYLGINFAEACVDIKSWNLFLTPSFIPFDREEKK